MTTVKQIAITLRDRLSKHVSLLLDNDTRSKLGDGLELAISKGWIVVDEELSALSLTTDSTKLLTIGLVAESPEDEIVSESSVCSRNRELDGWHSINSNSAPSFFNEMSAGIESKSGSCDWCNTYSENLTKDVDIMAGYVTSWVCPACIRDQENPPTRDESIKVEFRVQPQVEVPVVDKSVFETGASTLGYYAFRPLKLMEDDPNVKHGVGDSVIVASDGQDFEAKVQEVKSDGTYVLTFGTKKPSVVKPVYKKEELAKSAGIKSNSTTPSAPAATTSSYSAPVGGPAAPGIGK